jgi:predicted NBD/HSP70 family sugar kinase
MRPSPFTKEEFSEKEKRNIEILEILRRNGPISRPDISKQMGLNVVTVSNYIDDFVKHDLVYEKELDVSEGGRRPALLDLNAEAGYIIGVGVNLANMVGVLTDLKGNIITKTQLTRPRACVGEVTNCLLEIIREIIRRSKGYTTYIKGIGVGIAGLINKNDGSIRWPQKEEQFYTYASVDLPLRDVIQREFDLPTLIENDATSACFGEYWLNLARDYKNLIYMFSGVGCGIVINGRIYTGNQGLAGEISVENRNEQNAHSCGNAQDCVLRRWEMDLGIVSRIRSMLIGDKNSEESRQFLKNTDVTPENLDLKTVFSLYKARQPLVLSVLDSAAKRLGIKIAFLVNLLNPQIVIIGGGLEEAGEEFLSKVNQTVRDWAFPQAAENLKIMYSELRENAVALGAASLVMQNVFARLL